MMYDLGSFVGLYLYVYVFMYDMHMELCVYVCGCVFM